MLRNNRRSDVCSGDVCKRYYRLLLMKNIWLRERALSPKRPTLSRSEVEYRPISASSASNIKMPPITRKNPNDLLSPKSSQHWIDGYTGYHKPQRIPFINKKTLKKTRSLLKKVESHPTYGVDGPGAPGGHIARKVNKMISESKETIAPKALLLRQQSKPYQFTEDLNSMISFGHSDITSRPLWEDRFPEYPKEIAAMELEKRMKQRADEKILATSESAILVIMRDILDMYTTKFHSPKTQSGKFQSPDHLNLDETHVWLRLRISLQKAGEAITHRQLEALGNLCRQYRASHSSTTTDSSTSPRKLPRVKIPPILIHCLRYLNLLLGGSHSFRSAQFILLRDLTALLKLIQNVRIFPHFSSLLLSTLPSLGQIDPLKLPLDNIRNATTFRIKDMKILSILSPPPPQTSSSSTSVVNTDHGSVAGSVQSHMKKAPVASLNDAPSEIDSVHSTSASEVAIDSLCQAISRSPFSSDINLSLSLPIHSLTHSPQLALLPLFAHEDCFGECRADSNQSSR
jgi:hypothetical protein